MEIVIIIGIAVILFHFFKKKSETSTFLESNDSLSKSVELKEVENGQPFHPIVAVIDVETTGLIIDNSIRATKKNVAEFPENFPRIVQVCWMLIDNYGKYQLNSFYVKQQLPIPSNAIAIHGITNEKCEREGWDLSFVLKMLSRDVAKVDSIVGHNVSFDYKVLQAEYLREKIGFPLRNKNKIDTMRLVGKMMGKPHGFKISLKNAADTVFGIDPKWESLKNELKFHDAEVDTEITAYLYYGLKDL